MSMVKRTLNLVVSFQADDEGSATRKIRSLLKWLGRSWNLKVERINWQDEPPKATTAGNATPPYRGR